MRNYLCVYTARQETKNEGSGLLTLTCYFIDERTLSFLVSLSSHPAIKMMLWNALQLYNANWSDSTIWVALDDLSGSVNSVLLLSFHPRALLDVMIRWHTRWRCLGTSLRFFVQHCGAMQRGVAPTANFLPSLLLADDTWTSPSVCWYADDGPKMTSNYSGSWLRLSLMRNVW